METVSVDKPRVRVLKNIVIMIPPLFNKSVYAKRRSVLLDGLEPNRDLVVFFTSPFRYRNHDSSFRFRPESSFLYLTGYAEEHSAFMLWKEQKGQKVQTFFRLFTMPKDPAREQWDGFRYGPEKAKQIFGAQEAFEIKDLETQILDWLGTKPLPGQAPRIHSNAFGYSEQKEWLDKVLERFSPPHRSKIRPLESMHDARPLVEDQRLVKSRDEIAVMKKAGEINVKAHLAVMHQIKPGMFEYEMQALVEYEYMRAGCPAPAYTTICAGGANATILHYIENSEKLKAGDLFLIDAGCEYNFYASDITRTLPVGGRFSESQRKIMDIVADAHEEAIRCIKPGVRANKPHLVAEEVLIEGLLDLKILKGTKKQILESQAHKRYYPHGTSHWLGMDVHDACPYLDHKGEYLKLESGMVFTIEPGLYFMENDETVAEEWRGIGVRIEDDVVVTNTKAVMLTEGLPRRAKDIEKEMPRRKA